jgi:hypothetical protein
MKGQGAKGYEFWISVKTPKTDEWLREALKSAINYGSIGPCITSRSV